MFLNCANFSQPIFCIDSSTYNLIDITAFYSFVMTDDPYLDNLSATLNNKNRGLKFYKNGYRLLIIPILKMQ